MAPGARWLPRRGAWVALGLAVLLGLPGCGEAAETTSTRPAVVLIVLDALGASHVQHLGYERDTTPTLDRLAAEGLTCERAFAPAPYTVASIPSLLTGRLPDTHGVVRYGRVLRDEEATLAEHLSSLGYETFAAIANPNGGAEQGMAQGFDVFLEMFRPEESRDRAGGGAAAADDRDDYHVPKAEEYLDVVDAWIDARDSARPPLFYLHFLEPHSPYTPPEPFRSRYLDPAYDGPFLAGDTETLVATMSAPEPPTAADVAASRALYDGNLAYVDHVLEQLFERLRAAGLYDNALIVVTSDHGEAFWEHGRWGHNDHLFEEMVGVPLVAKLPASHAAAEGGRRIEGLASIVDVLPSVCAWLGLPLPAGAIEGRSLAGPAASERQLMLRTNDAIPDLALRGPRMKRWLRGPDGVAGAHGEHPAKRGDVVVYDLIEDPQERSPRASGPADEAFLTTLKRYAGRILVQASEAPGIELGERERRLLRKLGYTE